MKNTEFLFHLIRSMTKRDKDNFMRHAKVRSKRADLKYLELYHAIERQKVYNEAALKEQFSFSNFSEAKKHLSHLLLRVLRIYDEHPETSMQNRLTEIRILLDRSLYHFAMKKIRQAREIALAEERYDALRTLANYELVALPFVAKPKEVQPRRAAIVHTRDEAFGKLDAIRRLKDIHDKEILAAIDRTSQSGAFSAELMRELEKHPALHLEDESLPVRAQSTKYRIWNVIRHHQLDFRKRAEVLNRMLAIYEANSFLIEEEPVRYVFSLGGYGMCLNVIGQHQEALEATLKLLLLKSDNPNVQRSVFLNFASNICTYTLNTGDTGPFREHRQVLLNGLKTHAENTPIATLAYIHYLLAIVFWCADDIRRANRFAKRVVSEPAGRNNLQAACKCFLLIFAYEENDPDLIEQYARTWKRLWQKKAPQFEIERNFTDFMLRLINLPAGEDIREALRECLADVRKYLKGGFKVRADNFIFLVHWLNARIEGKPVVDVIAAPRAMTS